MSSSDHRSRRTQARRFWGMLAIAELVMIYAWHATVMHGKVVPFIAVRSTYAFGFFLFAVFLLATLSRLKTPEYLPIWRFLTMLIGGVVAAIEVNLHGFPSGLAPLFWACAMIGISLACILARLAPRPLRVLWLDLEADGEAEKA